MSSAKRSPSTSESSFHASLKASLVSRESRQIRRRLPVPSDPILTSSSPPSTSSSSSSSPSGSDSFSPSESTFEPTPSPTFFAPTVPLTASPSTIPSTRTQPLQPLDFSTNDYLSLSTSSPLRTHFLRTLTHTPHILGSGGSRLLVNPTLHDRFERRLARFYKSEEALLWNSGFDANVGVFGCLPRGWGGGGGGRKGAEGKGGEGDWVVFDEYVHASVWDGMRAWESRNHDRSASSSPSSSSSSSTQRKSHCIPFKHNDMASLCRVLETLIEKEEGVREGRSTVFVAVESLYSMDGTVAPLKVIVGMLEELFGEGSGIGSNRGGKNGVGRRKKREAYVIVDEAHATGIYGPQGRGMVAREGLEESPWILARLVTFGKALAASGAVLLTNTVVRDYLLNYARPLIYTTALSNANIVAASCSFDMLENGVAGEIHLNLSTFSLIFLSTDDPKFQLIQLSAHLLDLCDYFLNLMRKAIKEHGIPAHILCLPEHLVSPLLPSSPTPSTPSHLIPTSTSTYPSASHPTDSSSSHAPPPTPIIPLLTPHPRSLAAYLLSHHAITIKPITYPTVPKGKERVRVCLRAGMGRVEVERLVDGVVGWVGEVRRGEGEVKAGEEMGERGKGKERERARL
ncbi:PLP-dependent transferase [Stereum hirsutum FP-91666 SS1]|uniref:PLP-dependent transferase n=1 Tax=Stereum hirsutum (strain FP-91666) TaxID=721885 RepID=UPI000440FD8D|nr:PLP-dependent transferase [Stereum hirsutum FP-91666 SS1]EIM91229.1 PLP-dependent transferase [Stereum hirsutum FP-91666 SS1]